MNRKTFLKSACITGSCLCGFGAVSLAADHNSTNEETDLFKSWISTLLNSLSGENSNEPLKRALKNAAMAHYDHLNMEEKLQPYIGKLDNFVEFLEKTWGWKVTHDKEKNILVADENKNYCVCPLVRHDRENKTDILCNCSEGFAEKMFSVIIGHPVVAEVTTSVLRGGESCRYEINLNEK